MTGSVGEKQEEFGSPGKIELHFEDLSGGYDAAGMRPKRRLSGRNGRGGASRAKEPSHWRQSVNPRVWDKVPNQGERFLNESLGNIWALAGVNVAKD